MLHVDNEVAAWSVIFGGMVYCLPNWLVGLYLNKPGADSAAKVVMKAYIGFVYKLLVSVALFVYIFKFKQVHLLTFFLGYIAAYAVQCMLSFGINKRN